MYSGASCLAAKNSQLMLAAQIASLPFMFILWKKKKKKSVATQEKTTALNTEHIFK